MFYFHPYLGKWSNLTYFSPTSCYIWFMDHTKTSFITTRSWLQLVSCCMAAWNENGVAKQKNWLCYQSSWNYPPKKSHGNLQSTINENVFPIENGDFPASHVRFLGGPYSGTHTWRWDYRKLESLEIGLNFQGVVHVLLGTPPKKRTRNLKIPPWKRINKNTNHQFWGSMLIFGCIHSGNQT